LYPPTVSSTRVSTIHRLAVNDGLGFPAELSSPCRELAGQPGHLIAAQPRRPAAVNIREPDLIKGGHLAPSAEELTERPLPVHIDKLRRY
jgi:hypothetical protein